jgi:hypothetical protein
MTETYPIYGSHTVAAATPPTSKSPFNKGAPIVRVGETYVRVRSWHRGEGDFETRVAGEVYSRNDFNALVGAGHFLPFPTTRPAVADTMVWVLRPNHPRFEHATRDVLTASDSNLYDEFMPGPEDSRIFVVQGGSRLLLNWHYDAIGRAETRLVAGDLEQAEVEAFLAFATSPVLDPNMTGMLSAIYEAQRRQQRADGMLVMALRSRGPDFERKVIEARDIYRTLLDSRREVAP